MKKCPHSEIKINNKREIIYSDNLLFPWKQDPYGYFLVKIENSLICCGFVNSNHELIIELRGKNPDNMVREITRRSLCSKDNLVYVAQELMIAYECLINNKKYVQR